MIRALFAPAAACLVVGHLAVVSFAQGSPQASPGQGPAVVPAAPQVSAATLDAMARATARIRALHQEAEALARQERTLLGDLRRLEVERDLRIEESRRLDAEAADLQARIVETRAEVETLRASVDALRPSLERRLVEVYKLGRPGYGRLLLGARDVRDAGRMVRQTMALAAIDQRRVDELTGSLERMRQATADLRKQAAALETVQESARAAANDARKAAEARAELVRQIDARRDLAAQMAGELEVVRLRLGQVVPGAPTEASLPIKPFRGSLDWPVAGRLLSRFNQPSRSVAASRQNGIEIAAAEGETVRAVHEGRVVFADVFAGFGQLIIVDHGALGFSLYGYLGSVGVEKGGSVRHGQTVGTVGRSPAGSPALYFELRIDGHPVDPVQWLKPAR
ncbi:MAG TPA: peptidoglycan DD-metalloendopeptidase family protein [Vicinamibacterales bacterium]|nr:peptidoglycan DD-metalloendopeptidase family protein [Vicinamibacterales bacterium]